MTNDERNLKDEKKPGSRQWVLWVSIFGGIILLMFIRDKWWENQGQVISQYQFEQLLDDGQIAQATIVYDTQNQPLTEVIGQYKKAQNDQSAIVPFRTRVRLTGGLEERLLRLSYVDAHQPNTMLMSVFWSLLPIVLIAALIWFFFVRQIKKASKGSPSLEERIKKEVEQQQRFDTILDRWEQQADRMDKILQRGENQAAPSQKEQAS